MSNIAKDDILTVSRVYDNLKSPTFLKNLYWDILSSIKEKNTYKYMRGRAEKLINQNMETLNGLNNSEGDNMRRKTIVAEICTMSYAIDTVFSKILYMKLEKACRGQILNIIRQLKNEGKIPENVWSKFELKEEGSKAKISAEESVVKIDQGRKVQKTRVARRKRKIVSNSFLKDINNPNSNKEILEDLKKVNGVKEVNIEQNTANYEKRSPKLRKLRGKIKEFPPKNVSDPGASTSSQKLMNDDVSSLSSVDKIIKDATTPIPLQTHNEEADVSDAESDISFGCVSLESVSSVNTSDLSSFDDEISLSSDDEAGKKKKISLKELQKMFSEKATSSITKKNNVKLSKSPESKEKPDKEVAENKKKTNEASVNDTRVTAESKPESASFPSLNENGLPKRARKPNFKYSSDDVLCTAFKVKERKKAASYMTNTNGKVPSHELSPLRKKSKVDNGIMGDVAKITQSINNEESCVVTPTRKQPETPDLCKSFSANRSLTSRRTAPVTLFST